MKRTAQNLIEFVFIIPLLILILFGIVEFGIFYRTVSVVEDIAKDAAVTASRRFVLDTMASNDITDITNAGFNKAVKAAMDVVNKRKSALGVTNLTFVYTDLGADSAMGVEPYALYQIDSVETRTIEGVVTPLVTLVVDYRNPPENGITVQLVYQYRTLLVGAQLPVLGGPPVVIIPRDIPVSSTRIKQAVTY